MQVSAPPTPKLALTPMSSGNAQEHKWSGGMFERIRQITGINDLQSFPQFGFIAPNPCVAEDIVFFIKAEMRTR